MAFGLYLTQDAAVEPVTTADAKLYLRIDPSDTTDDAQISALIKAARKYAETYTRRAFISQTWDLWLDQIPYGRDRASLPAWWDGVKQAPVSLLSQAAGVIEIPKSPVISVDSITTYDLSDIGHATDLTTLVIQLETTPPIIFPKIGQIWPVPIRPRQGVKVGFTAGYGATAANVPGDIIQAIKLLVAHFYENRGVMVESRMSEVPFSVRALLDSYRMTQL
jgi:hypothetical protein